MIRIGRGVPGRRRIPAWAGFLLTMQCGLMLGALLAVAITG